jgi:hypothetical protein
MNSTTYQKLQEQIMSVLYDNHPQPLSALVIAEAMVRDHELVRRLLRELEDKRFVAAVKQGKMGEFTTWRRWKLSPEIYKRYEQIAQKEGFT